MQPMRPLIPVALAAVADHAGVETVAALPVAAEGLGVGPGVARIVYRGSIYYIRCSMLGKKLISPFFLLLSLCA